VHTTLVAHGLQLVNFILSPCGCWRIRLLTLLLHSPFWLVFLHHSCSASWVEAPPQLTPWKLQASKQQAPADHVRGQPLVCIWKAAA
jgi:hypothetical protein